MDGKSTDIQSSDDVQDLAFVARDAKEVMQL
jgi:hypothetical protein